MKKMLKITAAFAVILSLCVQLAAAVSYQYDKIGRVISATYKNGTAISYAYDSSGNITKIKQDGVRKIMVTFNPNGGVCDTANKTVITGQEYGELPIATRDEYYFDGWYTQSEQGDKITAEDTVEILESHMLYAHWSVHNYVISEQLPGETVYTCEHCGESYIEVETAYEWYYNGRSPYQIAQADELCAFAALANSEVSFKGKTVELCANITADLEASIGTSEHPFKGTFDGNGHEITLESAVSGVFGCIDEAGTVMNLSVNAEIAAADKTVGMIANVNNGEIQNCAARGLIASEDGTVGGIVGQNNGTIYNCLYDGDISYNGKSASKCVNQDNGEYLWDVTNEAWGAICGQNNGNITYCFYGIEDDINNPKHSGVNGTEEYNTVHMYTEKYYIFGFFAGFKYVGYELDEQAQQNENFVRWNAEKETCPTLQSR